MENIQLNIKKYRPTNLEVHPFRNVLCLSVNKQCDMQFLEADLYNGTHLNSDHFNKFHALYIFCWC